MMCLQAECLMGTLHGHLIELHDARQDAVIRHDYRCTCDVEIT